MSHNLFTGAWHASSPVARDRLFWGYKESGGERSDGKGREGEVTGKSCIQDGGRINGGFPGIIPRPVHEAVRMKKIICPEQNCCENMIFFEESGLGHHYRTIHKKDANAKVITKARSKTQEIYGGETLQFISTICEWKSKEGI